ncbi:hypothetical protein HN51_049610 [Arachis hypogaea]
MIGHKMKKVGYKFSLSQYEVLLQAYLIAKLPAHGMRDMMKADNISIQFFVAIYTTLHPRQ